MVDRQWRYAIFIFAFSPLSPRFILAISPHITREKVTAKIHLFFPFLAREGEKNLLQKNAILSQKNLREKRLHLFSLPEKNVGKSYVVDVPPLRTYLRPPVKVCLWERGGSGNNSGGNSGCFHAWYLRHPMRGNSPSFSFRTSPPPLLLLGARETSTSKFRHL